MVTDHLVDDEAQEFFGKLWIELRFRRQMAQPGYLALLPAGICSGQAMRRFVPAHRLRYLEALREHVDQSRIDVVDALAVSGQQVVSHQNTLSLVRRAFCGDATGSARRRTADRGELGQVDARQGLLCRGIGVRGSGR